MGYFTDGYKQGEAIQFNNCTAEEHEKILKGVLENGSYKEIVEWYNGFYKAMLDVDLKRLEQGFTALKKEAQKGME